MFSELRGASITPIKTISDERGCVKKFDHAEALRYSCGINDAYVTTVHKGAIKGWHGYESKTIGFSCIKGKIRLVLWNRVDEEFEEHFIGDENPVTVWASPGVFTAFKGIAEENIIVVLANEIYREESVIRISPDNYDWDIKNG